jgi:hypothetical protein
MAIESISSKIIHNLTTGILSYEFPYKFFSAGDLEVYSLVGGVETQLMYGTDWNLDEVQEVYPEGANIVLATSITATTGDTLTIRRIIPLTQPARLPNGGQLDTEALEIQLDRAIMIIQQMSERLDRAVCVSVTNQDSLDVEEVVQQIEDTAVAVATVTQALVTVAQALADAQSARDLAQHYADIASQVSNVPLKASGAEVLAGTDDAKFVTAKAILDAVTAGMEFPDMPGCAVNLGDGTDKTAEVVCNNADANKPKIRYNKDTNAWEFSNNGVDFTSIPSSNGANVGCVALTTSTGVYTGSPSPAFSFGNLAYINVIPDEDGHTSLDLNEEGAKTIYSPYPLEKNVQYELVYFTAGTCFLARKKDSVVAPASTSDYSVGWRALGNAIANVVKTNRDASAWSTFSVVTQLNNPFGAVGGGSNMVLLPDGKVLCVPYTSNSAKVFDPSDNSFTSKGSFPAPGGYSSGVQLANGLTLVIPYTHASPNKLLKLYNSTAGAIEGIDPDDWATLTSVVGASNLAGVQLDSGLVLITPAYAGTDCYLLDPVNDTVAVVPGRMDANIAKSTPVLAPNGNVYVFTDNAYFYEYNPQTNVVTKNIMTTAISGSSGTCMLHNGLVWAGNTGGSTNDALFDSTTRGFALLGDKITTATMTSACLLPDGRIYVVGKLAQALIYDPITNTIVTPSSSPALDSYVTNIPCIGRHVLLLNNGKLLVSSYNNIKWYLISNASAQTNFSLGTLVSKVLNKR